MLAMFVVTLSVVAHHGLWLCIYIHSIFYIHVAYQYAKSFIEKKVYMQFSDAA